MIFTEQIVLYEKNFETALTSDPSHLDMYNTLRESPTDNSF